MYLFYQLKGGEENWHKVEDTPENRAKVAEKAAAFVAALSISATDNIDLSKVKYKGDLYFDIDSSDLEESITVVNKLVRKLQEMEVKNINVYCSGKKGFHVTVPAKVFSKGAQVTYLPYVYGKIAEKLEIAGLDFAVYSGGRGRLWRQTNVVRPEIHTFKVQIPVERLRALTPEKYRVYVSAPAPIIDSGAIEKSLELSELYEACKIQVQEEQKKLEKFEFKAIPELEELKEVPKCIHKLITEGDQKKGSNFNKAAMQLAGYVKSSGHDRDTIREVVSTMADSVKSGTYNTREKRIKHIYSQIRRAKNDPRMGFSPSYLFSTIEPCGGCILCDGTLDKYDPNSKKVEAEVEHNPVFAADGRYYVRQGKMDRSISTFTISPLTFSEVYDPVHNTPERESTTVAINYEHLGVEKQYKRNIPERSWDSVSAFKSSISGIDNVSFMGGEHDLAHLKNFVFSRESEMGRVMKTNSCGLTSYRNYLSDRTLLVYTEKNGSLNMFGEPDTHQLSSEDVSAPSLLGAEDLSPDNELHVTLAKKITEINDPVKMAQILGWYVACHFKPHILAVEKQFPLLGLWGNAGSGKTRTAALMAYLHGCDFEGADSITTCGGSTAWALTQYVGSSTSTPRLIDEFNAPKIAKAKYPLIVDMLKGCFNQQVNKKGKLGNRSEGAKVDGIRLTGPVVVMSEQFPENEPPLIQRMVTVKLTRKAREPYEGDYEFVYDNRVELPVIGKALVMSALKTPVRTVKHWMNHYKDEIPNERELDARPHYSYRVVLTGLKLYEMVMESYGIDVTQEVHNLTSKFIDYLFKAQKEISQSKARSVVDEIIDVMAAMATNASKNSFSRNGMDYGKGYIRDADRIWIDAEGVYTNYKMYSRHINEPVLIGSYRQFRDLLSEEPYFIDDELCPPLSKARTCICLDVEKMLEKGLSANLFELSEGDEDE